MNPSIQNNMAVIYARFSSNNQREESIDAQLRACEEYASRNGYIVVNKYCDSAKSGTSADREQFQKMISDSEENNFQFVIVHKLDRFSRDKYDSVYYKRKLKNNGIRVISALENLSDDPESIMLESVLEGMSQYYSANLAREVMKGLKENAYQCKHTGGIAPLGYSIDKDTLKYIINEEEAKIVRTIFTMYNNCCGYSEILTHLNSLGYKTKVNKPFSKSSINTILKNEKYRGVYIYNRKKEFDFNRKRRPKEKAESEVIRIENGMPRIINDDTFYKANHLMSKNKLRSGSYNGKHNYLLSGLIECGKCGSSICGNSRTGGKTKSMYTSYRCSSKVSKKDITCTCKEIRKDYIEHFVLDELSSILFTNDNIQELIKLINDYNKQNIAITEKDITKNKARLNDINNEIGNLLKLVTTKNIPYETVEKAIQELEASKVHINEKIATLEKEMNIEPINIEKLESLITSSKDFILTKNISECRKYIDSYINKVLVYTNKVEIIFNISTINTETNEASKLTSTITREDLYSKYKYLIKSK